MKQIDRKLFVTLEYCKVDHMYFILNDGNFVEKFYADSDEEAKQIFRSKYGK